MLMPIPRVEVAERRLGSLRYWPRLKLGFEALAIPGPWQQAGVLTGDDGDTRSAAAIEAAVGAGRPRGSGAVMA